MGIYRPMEHKQILCVIYGDTTCFPYEAGLHHLLDLEAQEKQPPFYGIQQNYFQTVAHIWPVYTPSYKLRSTFYGQASLVSDTPLLLDMVVIPKLRLPVASIGRLGKPVVGSLRWEDCCASSSGNCGGRWRGHQNSQSNPYWLWDFLRYEKGLRTVYQNSQSDIISWDGGALECHFWYPQNDNFGRIRNGTFSVVM